MVEEPKLTKNVPPEPKFVLSPKLPPAPKLGPAPFPAVSSLEELTLPPPMVGVVEGYAICNKGRVMEG